MAKQVARANPFERAPRRFAYRLKAHFALSRLHRLSWAAAVTSPLLLTAADRLRSTRSGARHAQLTKENLGLGNQDPRVHWPWDMLGESGNAGGCLSPSMGGRAQPREAPSRTAPGRAVYGSVWARGVMLCVSLVMGCVRWSFLTVHKPQKRQLDAFFIIRTPPTTVCWDAATRTAVHVASAPP